MKDLKLFSIEEMSVLEALNVKGNIYQYVWVYVHAIMEAHHIVNSMEWT